MPAPVAAPTERFEEDIALIARPAVRNQVTSASPVSGPRIHAAVACRALIGAIGTPVDLHSDG